MRKVPLPLLLAALLGLSQCKKKSVDPASQLPPVTQTGANTFGCLVNGELYLPQGNMGTSNFNASYDPTFRGGTLDIRAYNCSGNCATANRTVLLGAEGITRAGTYPLASNGPQSVSFFDESKVFPCSKYRGNGGAYVVGTLTISRLDGGIVSGTFNCKLFQAGCDTLRITQGRFDAKF